MSVPDPRQFSLLPTPKRRENGTVPHFPHKRPRVQAPHCTLSDTFLTPQPQTGITEDSFSFYAEGQALVKNQQVLPASSSHEGPAPATLANRHATHNPQLSVPNPESLNPSFQFISANSQPAQPPLLNALMPSSADIEVIDLDEDDGLQPSISPETQPPHQNPATAQPLSGVQSDVIDLDDDEALANLQPLHNAQPSAQTTSQTRLHLSRGGGLFRIQSSGHLEIVDSEDEEELSRTHRIASLDDGLHTISNVTDPMQQPTLPTIQLPAVSSAQEPSDRQERPAPNQLVTPAQPEAGMGLQPPHFATITSTSTVPLPANEMSQALQTVPVTSSFQFSTPTITRWPQPNLIGHVNAFPTAEQLLPSFASLSGSAVFEGFAPEAPDAHLRDQEASAFFPSAPALPNSRAFSSTALAQNGASWLNARSPQALFQAHERIALARSWPNPANPFSFADFDPFAPPDITPTHLAHQGAFLSTNNQAHGESDRAVNEGGISAEGLRNLVKQNSLTADATEESESPTELNVSLMPHQKRALHWMAKREVPVETDEDISAVDEQGLGGILADDQGLGKTLTMIALLLKNRPGSDGDVKKTEGKEATSDVKKTKEKEVASDGKKTEEKEVTSDGSIDLEKESNEEDEIEAGLMSDDNDFVPPDRSEDAPWKTLIVCPLSVINQWKEELNSRIRADFRPRVCIYHGPKRERRLGVLESCDVVITTYATLVTEYPKELKDHPDYKAHKKAKLPVPTRSAGPICRVSWNRVVLDEAQHVKNRGTDSWSAVMSLKAELRWCLTGTPIQNSVDDIYSLFLFIRYRFVPNYETWNTRWKKKLEHPSAMVRERAFKRFQTIVGVVLLRRTKNDKIKGAPLITLPKRQLEVETPEFCDKEEEVVYRAVQEKSVLTFNKFLVAGTLANNYSSVLLVLLRLRQACSHPFLIEYAGMHSRGRSHSQSSDEVTSDKYSTCYSMNDLEQAMELVVGGCSLLSMIDDAARQRVQAALMPPIKGRSPSTRISCLYCQRETPWPQASFLACGDLFCPDCCHLLRKERKCLRCLSNIEDPNESEVFINADHLRKEVHANVIVAEPEENEVTITAAQFKSWFQLEVIKRRSGSSSTTVTPDTTDAEVDDANEDEDEEALDQLEKSILEKKTKAKDDRKSTKGNCAVVEAKKERLLRAISQHSTKIRRILDKLNEIRKRNVSEKTLIFSQWTSMLDIIEFHVQLEGHEVCRLDGSMTLSARQKQIEGFKASPTKNVFLISLHAGGTGLNLTVASNVIIADVWWNPAVEEQAIDRVHRIGQTKDVNVTRFKMKGTVEERIYAICAKKREAADGTLGVTGAQSLGRKKLSLQELMFIFGGAAQDVAQSAQRGSAAAEAANNILNYQQFAR